MSDSGGRSSDGSDQRGPGIWVAAFVLIAVGVVFLFQNMGYEIPGNWWALALLIPAVVAFGSAVSLYRKAGGQVTGAVFGPVLTGVVLLILTVVFLFDYDVDWALFWPIILILLGLSVLARAQWRR